MRRGVHAAAWVALVVAAFVLWPQRWGGTMTYDITHGTSMQPTFRAGDLAILRTSSSYDVGDVAAYRSPSLKTTVMHRVKTKTAKGYTFQGDNNNFVDPDTVTDKQMIGKLVFRVPGVGKFLQWLLKPINLVLLAGAVFFLLSDRKERHSPATPAIPSGFALVPTTAAAPAPATAPVIVRITALHLPDELPTADVASPDDLAALAALHGIAILRGPDADFLLQGGMLFRCDHVRPLAATPPRTRRPGPHGRDWDYGTGAAGEVVDLDSRRPA